MRCSLRLASLLAYALLGVACSDGGTGRPTPSAPTPPAAAPPVQAANLPATIGANMEFPDFDPREGWTFAGRGQNVGQGCAANVRGTARFMDAGMATLQTVEFSLDAATRIRPAETFLYQGCCVTEGNGRARSLVAVVFSWENVACP